MLKKIYHFLLIKNLAGKELSDEKIHDFKRLMLAQISVAVSLFLLELFIHLGFPYHIQIAETIFFAALGFYVFFLWDMLRNYTRNRSVIMLNFVFIMGVFLVGVIAVNPFLPMPVTLTYRLVLAGIQFCLLAVECTVIYFTLMEFFKKELGMSMRLWGAACIYLMIGFAFGSAYEIICILEIQCMGIDIPLQTMGLMKRFEFSLMVLSGMDSPYGNAAGMIFSLGTLEALWGQLFVVLIVGRLMMKQEQNSSPQ
jgi:hypothetical protein